MKSLGEQRREDESEKTVVTRWLEISAKNANCYAARTGCRVIENTRHLRPGVSARRFRFQSTSVAIDIVARP